MHVRCRSNYTNYRTVDTAFKRRAESVEHETSKKIKSGSFHFKPNCFLCGNFISAIQIRHGKSVSVVSKSHEMDNTIMKLMELRNYDEWAMIVKERLDLIEDL